MPELYIAYTQTETGGRICPGQEDSNYPSREDRYLETSFECALRERPKYSYSSETITVSEQVFAAPVVFVAIGVYQDGNTFGCTHGNIHFIGAYLTHKEAAEAAHVAETKPEDYVPWNGYFTRFESTQVKPLMVS